MSRWALLLGALMLREASGWGGEGATASAQSSGRLRDAAVAEYRTLAYDSAIVLLHRSLAAEIPQPPPDSERAGTYVFLGAAEHLRGRDPEARAAFVAALRADPRIRVDTLMFPPAITALFQSVSRNTAFVAVRAARDSTVTPDTGRYRMQVYVSSPRHVTVEIWTDSAASRNLFTGLIADSASVGWNGLATDGSRVRDGVAEMRISVSGESNRVLRLPIQVHWVRAPGVSGPPSVSTGVPTSLPAPSHSGGDVRALAIGLLTGLVVAVLPNAVSDAPHPSDARFVVAGAASIAGVLAFTRIGGHPTPPAASAAPALDQPRASPAKLEIRALWTATDLEAAR